MRPCTRKPIRKRPAAGKRGAAAFHGSPGKKRRKSQVSDRTLRGTTPRGSARNTPRSAEGRSQPKNPAPECPGTEQKSGTAGHTTPYRQPSLAASFVPAVPCHGIPPDRTLPFPQRTPLLRSGVLLRSIGCQNLLRAVPSRFNFYNKSDLHFIRPAGTGPATTLPGRSPEKPRRCRDHAEIRSVREEGPRSRHKIQMPVCRIKTRTRAPCIFRKALENP